MKEQPIRVAHIVGKMVGGGVESFIMNYYRNIDRTKIQFDFIIDEDSTVIPQQEIEELGGRIIIIPPYQKIFKYFSALKKIFKENNYRIVHSHLNVLSVFPLFAAYLAKVPVRVAHSHSTTNKKEWKKNFIKSILKPFSKVFATDYFACSEHAARWLFGNKMFNQGKVQIIHNAIDVDKFKYNEKIRKKIRKELQIENKFVLGHVGRFVEQKNHIFLIDVFSQVYKENMDAVLLLIGDGPLENEIKEKIKKSGLEKKVYFLGIKDNVNEYMQAMDVFVFPSLYEGLGMVLVEAQTAGLNCIVSKNIPLEVKLSDKIEFIDDDVFVWKEKILNNKCDYKRNDAYKIILNSKYNIINQSNVLGKKYLKELIKMQNIELFGLPGCGKSTIAKKQFGIYRNNNVRYIYHNNRVIRNIKKILNSVETVCVNFEKCRKSKKYISRIENIKLKIKMFIYFFCTINICNKAKNRSVIVEEGMLQVLWAICYNSNYDKIMISNYIEDFKDLLGSRIIYIETDYKIIERRLKNRNSIGGSELEHDLKYNRNVLDRAIKIKNDIIEVLRERNIDFEILKGDLY